MTETKLETTIKRKENIVLPAPGQMSNEELGEYVANESVGVLKRLDVLKPYFEELWKRFDALKDGETIQGCRTRTEFCEKILHRTRRSVQYILYGRPAATLPAPKPDLEPDSELETIDVPSPDARKPKPIEFPQHRKKSISDHIAVLTELLSEFTDLNDVVKLAKTNIDAPTRAELETLVTTLRKISRDADQRAVAIERALVKEAAA